MNVQTRQSKIQTFSGWNSFDDRSPNPTTTKLSSLNNWSLDCEALLLVNIVEFVVVKELEFISLKLLEEGIVARPSAANGRMNWFWRTGMPTASSDRTIAS